MQEPREGFPHEFSPPKFKEIVSMLINRVGTKNIRAYLDTHLPAQGIGVDQATRSTLMKIQEESLLPRGYEWSHWFGEFARISSSIVDKGARFVDEKMMPDVPFLPKSIVRRAFAGMALWGPFNKVLFDKYPTSLILGIQPIRNSPQPSPT